MHPARPDPSWIAATPIYPISLAAAMVLGAYAGFPGVSIDQVWRPLGVAALGGGAVLLVGGALTRKWHATAYVVALIALAIVGLWELLLLAIAARTFVAWRGVRMRHDTGGTAVLTYPFNVLSTAWLAVSAAAAVGVATSPPPSAATPAPMAVAPAAADLPNIYVVLLDGYPRADSLLDYFGFDNRQFLDALRARDFHVSEHSVTDEATTFLTVPSMLHMQTAGALGLLPYGDSPEERRRVFELINASPVVATMRQADYEIHSIVPGVAPVDLRDADVVWESKLALSLLETSIIDGGVFNLIGTEWFYAQRRQVVGGAFEALTTIVKDRQDRLFVFAHIMSPHAPFAFEADGSPRSPLPCAPWCGLGTADLATLGMTLDELSTPVIGQLEYVNSRVLETVDAIRTADRDAVIVVLSDHGARIDPDDSDEWHRTLFAARTPGEDALFGDAPTPTNLFRGLLNQYLGTDLPPVPNAPRSLEILIANLR